jgi:hypothetical protein
MWRATYRQHINAVQSGQKVETLWPAGRSADTVRAMALRRDLGLLLLLPLRGE